MYFYIICIFKIAFSVRHNLNIQFCSTVCVIYSAHWCMAGLIKRNSMMKLKDSGYELIIPTGYHLCKCSKLSLCHLLLRYRPFSSLVLH